jgi:mRNA-degrading endonuclease RelE of RelBE toxin-antitoxin system
MTEFREVSEFSKELKRLNNKYRTLYEDLETFKTALNAELPNQLPHTVSISRLGEDVKTPIYKLRRFRCSYMKNKGNDSGFRIIYAYEQRKDRITLVEIYFKGNKTNHNKARIKKYFSIK